ncbi:MAG: hypothetical protein M3075_20680 [Candidatus Dormibacteraeota bacterium]|nr:hypothetical protein [Candidatus Dormibacteraeota bacterium]
MTVLKEGDDGVERLSMLPVVLPTTDEQPSCNVVDFEPLNVAEAEEVIWPAGLRVN